MVANRLSFLSRVSSILLRQQPGDGDEEREDGKRDGGDSEEEDDRDSVNTNNSRWNNSSAAPSRSDSTCSCLSCSVPGDYVPRESVRNEVGVRIQDFYRFDEVLGEGTFSLVYLAESRVVPENWAAVKVIQKRGKHVDDIEWQAEKEIRIMSVLDHAHIVHLNEVFDEEDTICFVMELAKGGEVFDRLIEQGNFSEKETASLVVQLLCALNYIHDQGIVHRDLKLENLLYYDDTQDSRIMVADFGLSEWVWDIQDDGPICGTPGYMAPEVIANKQVTPAADVWSVGVIAYILLAGYPPFFPEKDLASEDNENESDAGDEEDESLLLRSVAKGQFEFHPHSWRHVSDEAKDFIKRLMTVDPNERLTCDEALDHPWLQTAQVRPAKTKGWRQWSLVETGLLSISVAVISVTYAASISYLFEIGLS